MKLEIPKSLPFGDATKRIVVRGEGVRFEVTGPGSITSSVPLTVVVENVPEVVVPDLAERPVTDKERIEQLAKLAGKTVEELDAAAKADRAVD